jgi:hypothetical protein
LADASQFDLIVSTAAVLFEPRDDPPPSGISNEQLSSIIRAPLAVGQAVDGRTIISSNRDQIEIQVLHNKIDVREVSGNPQEGARKIARVLHEFLALANRGPVHTYGLNFILDIPLANPGSWLGEHLLIQDLPSKLSASVSSKGVSFVFDRAPKTLEFKFAPREPDKINVNINSSEEVDSLPPQEQVMGELIELYESLEPYLDLLGA